MKKHLLLFFILVLSGCLNAQIQYDTLCSYPVASGMIYTKIFVPKYPWSINVLEIDLKNKYNRVETVKALDRYNGMEITSSQAKRKSHDGHVVIGAVNADFYNMNNGNPINGQVSNGEIVCQPSSLSTIGFDESNRPMMDRLLSFSGSAVIGGSKIVLNGVNRTRSTNYLVLYNQYHGSTTGTNNFGSEVTIAPASGSGWTVNDTVYCIVKSKAEGQGNSAIKPGEAVLSGHGTAQTAINTLKVGDTVKIIQKFNGAIQNLQQLVGAYPRIIKNGVNYVDQGFKEEGGPDHTYDRHPRTAAGFSKDSSKLYLFTVDGRQMNSIGMSLPEVADFMLKLNVYNAVNFDGGGSTTMVIRDSIVNVTAGAERPVANTLIVVSSAPKGTKMAGCKLFPLSARVFKGESIKFKVFAWDEYQNPWPFDQSGASFSCSPSLGSITGNGVFTASMSPSSGYIYFTKDAVRDSAFIFVKDIRKVTVFPRSILTDSTKKVLVRLSGFDEDNLEHALENDKIIWTSSDPAVGNVVDGYFVGRASGKAKLTLNYQTASDAIDAEVVNYSGTSVVESFEDIGSWTVSTENADGANTKISISNDYSTEGSSSLKLDYQFTYDPAKVAYIYLNTTKPLAGAPDSLKMDIRSNGLKHTVYYTIADDNQELFSVSPNKYNDKKDAFETLNFCIPKASVIVSPAVFLYPVAVKNLKIKLGSEKAAGTVYSGTMYIDNIRMVYNAKTTDVDEQNNNSPNSLELLQNYPNPFNPVTTISYSLPEASMVKLSVFDILGREVALLVDGEKNAGSYKVQFNAQRLSSGTYFYRLQTGESVIVKKMIVLK